MASEVKKKRIEFRMSEETYATIKNRARACGKTLTDYLIRCATEDAETASIRRISEDEQVAWNVANADHLQLLRRVTVLIKMIRFMLSKAMEIPEKDINELMQQYIDATKKDIPERSPLFDVARGGPSL